MKKTSILIVLMILAAGRMPAMPEPAPGFALPNNHGSMLFKSSLKGNLIISFFASYCRPCAKELPLLVGLEKKYGIRKSLSLVLICADMNDADGGAKKKADRFLQKADVKHEYLLDIYQVVIAKYNPKKVLPALFLVNRAGNIVFREIGTREDTVRRLEKAIQSLQ